MPLAALILLDTPARIGYRIHLIRITSSAVRYCYFFEHPLDSPFDNLPDF